MAAPTSALQDQGLLASSLSTGINCGMLAASTNSAVLAIVSALGSVSSYLSFAYSGRTHAQGGMIQYGHSKNVMSF